MVPRSQQRRQFMRDAKPTPAANYQYDPLTDTWLPEQVVSPIQFGDSASVDAFGRLRISEPSSLFSSEAEYDESPLFWFTRTSGGGTSTHIYNDAAVRLRVANTNDEVYRQSKQYYRYQPGKSQLVALTCQIGQDAGATKRVGYFDENEGFFLEVTGTEIAWVKRKNGVDSRVIQANWNIDKLDGSGPTEVVLDIDKVQILVIDLQWLGVGRVRAGFDIDGVIHYAHDFYHSNIETSVYIRTANLPVRYEIAATDLSDTNVDLFQICSAVISEGGFEVNMGYRGHVGNEVTPVNVNAQRPILSIRPKALFNGHVNRGTIIPGTAEIFTVTENIHFDIIYGGTLTNASFNSVHDNSIVEYDVAATAIAGGFRVGGGYVPGDATGVNVASGSSLERLIGTLPLALDPDGNHPSSPEFTDALTVVVQTIPDAASDCFADLTWTELR